MNTSTGSKEHMPSSLIHDYFQNYQLPWYLVLCLFLQVSFVNRIKVKEEPRFVASRLRWFSGTQVREWEHPYVLNNVGMSAYLRIVTFDFPRA